MKKIREGNDIYVSWSIFDVEGAPHKLDGKELRVFLDNTQCANPRFHVPVTTSIEITEFTVSKNVISFCYYGRQQKGQIGEYTLRFIENDGADDMVTFDARRAFELVPHSWMEGQGETTTIEIEHVELASTMGFAPSAKKHEYLSLERLCKYLYRITFDMLPEDNGEDSPVIGGCSSYVKDGKLYTNLDWGYTETASFIVRTKDFEGQSFVSELKDGNLDDEYLTQLPYRVHRGINNSGIKVASHVLYNDWGWTGTGSRNISITRLPFLVLSKVKSMDTISQDLNGILGNLYCPEGLADLGYLLQILVTDGTTTYALMPPTSEGQGYVLQDITSCPKLANFRWVNKAEVVRAELQNRPTGVERWNMMPCELEELRFTKAYETEDRLSEFIGLRGTTKDSTNAELKVIYDDARAEYLQRERDGKTWQTMDSAVYGDRLEALYIQEDWSKNIIPATTEYVDNAAHELEEAIENEAERASGAESTLQAAISAETQRAMAKEAQLEAGIAQAGKVDDVKVDDISVVEGKTARLYTRIKGFGIGGTLHLELSHFLNLNNGKINFTNPYAHIDEATNKIYI